MNKSDYILLLLTWFVHFDVLDKIVSLTLNVTCNNGYVLCSYIVKNVIMVYSVFDQTYPRQFQLSLKADT